MQGKGSEESKASTNMKEPSEDLQSDPEQFKTIPCLELWSESSTDNCLEQ